MSIPLPGEGESRSLFCCSLSLLDEGDLVRRSSFFVFDLETWKDRRRKKDVLFFLLSFPFAFRTLVLPFRSIHTSYSFRNDRRWIHRWLGRDPKRYRSYDGHEEEVQMRKIPSFPPFEGFVRIDRKRRTRRNDASRAWEFVLPTLPSFLLRKNKLSQGISYPLPSKEWIREGRNGRGGPKSLFWLVCNVRRHVRFDTCETSSCVATCQERGFAGDIFPHGMKERDGR